MATKQDQWYDLREGRLFASRAPKDFAEWEDAVGALAAMKKNNPIWIGDILNLGEDTFGEAYAQVIDAFGVHNNYIINNYKWVARSVPPRVRRKSLFFSHLRAVASYGVEDQDHLLGWAHKQNIKTLQFARLLKTAKRVGTLTKDLTKLEGEKIYEWEDKVAKIEGEPDNYMVALNKSIDDLDTAIEFCEYKDQRDLLLISRDSAMDAKKMAEDLLVAA